MWISEGRCILRQHSESDNYRRLSFLCWRSTHEECEAKPAFAFNTRPREPVHSFNSVAFIAPVWAGPIRRLPSPSATIPCIASVQPNLTSMAVRMQAMMLSSHSHKSLATSHARPVLLFGPQASASSPGGSVALVFVHFAGTHRGVVHRRAVFHCTQAAHEP